MMKKVIALMLTLGLLSVGVLVICSKTINSQKDAVTIEETVLFGDRTVADGILINSRSRFQHHLFWDTDYIVREIPKVDTKYSFFAKETYPEAEYDHSGLGLDIDLYGTCNTELPADQQYGIARAFKELYDVTEVGSESTKEIYLKDYYDYYPIRIVVDLPNVSFGYSESDNVFSDKQKQEKLIGEAFRDFFKIPIMENETREISIAKNSHGLHYSSGYSTGIDYFGLWTVSAYTKNECYFTIHNRNDAGELVNTDLIPGGYGIYRFAYDQGAGLQGMGSVDANSLSMVYSLEEEVQVQYMFIDEGQNNLLLVTYENGATVLSVIGLSTMHLKQKIFIANELYHTIFPNDRYTVFLFSNTIALVELKTNGEYALKFTVTEASTVDETFAHLRFGAAMDFDGDRLAIVDTLRGEQQRSSERCSYYLAVYDATGLTFYGEYKNGLDLFPHKEQYGFNCHSDGYTVSLKGISPNEEYP